MAIFEQTVGPAPVSRLDMVANIAPVVIPLSVDHSADLFAIGVMLVEVLTGRRPFQGDNYGELSRALLHDDFHLPRSTPETVALDALLQRCLAKEARDRVRSAAELRRDLIPALREYGSI